jgi:glycosyltransferase involved in cell wall biosynthesis
MSAAFATAFATGVDVTVVVSARRAGERLRETLEALRTQRLQRRWELVLVDATRDGIDPSLLPVLEAPGPFERSRLERASPQLTRAGLRNFALGCGAGPVTVLLGAEATPKGPDLLAKLCAPLFGTNQEDKDLAAVQGLQEPHESCDPLGRRVLADRAKRLAQIPPLLRIEPGSAGWEEWRARAASLCVFDLSCAAVRTAVFARQPVPEAPPIDDDLWACALLEAGHSLRHVPDAVVLRSFAGAPTGLLRALRTAPGVRRKQIRPAPLATLPEPSAPKPERSALLTAAAKLAFGGARAAEVLRDEGPRAVLQRLRRRGEPSTPTSPGLSPPPPERPWWEQHPWPLLREPRKPVPPPRAGALGGPLQLCWVVPAFYPGSGGHNTLFRLVAGLERLGHTCEIVFTSHEGLLPSAGVQVRELVRRHFQPIAARCSLWNGGPLPEADVHVATHWDTAYVVDRRRRSGAGAYLVQDWEPGFYPSGTGSELALETYSLGLFHITAGPWLEARLKEAGRRAAQFDLAVSPEEYYLDPQPAPEKGRIAVYLRPRTPRRGFELAALALAEVQRQRPGLEVAVYGSPPGELQLPFEAKALGVLGPAALRTLYNGSTVGLCCSLTNYSLVPQEMMACGLPLVEADVPSTRAVFADGVDALLGVPTPLGLASALLRLLGDPALQQELREGGLKRVRGLTWERSAKQVEAALRAAVAASLGVAAPVGGSPQGQHSAAVL